MEKFLPLYSWDLNHVIQLYAYSLHGHVTTIQMQSIDFTPKTKNMNYSWLSGYPETVLDHELVQHVLFLCNINLCKKRILNHFKTAEWCWKRLKGDFNLKWNFFGKRWDESLLIFCFYKLISVLLNPSQTYTATALRPLRDWQFSPIAEVATRSPIGPGEVAEKSATDRGLRCDQISRSQVFVLAQKPGCDWFGRRQVPAKSPTSPRSVAD